MPSKTTSQQADSQPPTAGDESSTGELQAALVEALDLAVFPLRGYRQRDYLQAALDAGFEPAELATAHDVSRRSIYRAAAAHDLELPRPPTSGTAKLLWELDPDTVQGGPA